MKYKTLLIKFLEEKNKLVEKASNLVLITHADLEEVQNRWSEDICMDALNGMLTSPDASLCPWCIVLESCCTHCAYGIRHGACWYRSSLYNKIVRRAGNIAGIPGMKELAGKYIKITKRKANEAQYNKTKGI